MSKKKTLENCNEYLHRANLGPGEVGHLICAIFEPDGSVYFFRMERVCHERGPALQAAAVNREVPWEGLGVREARQREGLRTENRAS